MINSGKTSAAEAARDASIHVNTGSADTFGNFTVNASFDPALRYGPKQSQRTNPMQKLIVHLPRTLPPFLATVTVALTFVSAPIFTNTTKAQQAPTEEQAHAIGVDAYLYFYPLSRWTLRANNSAISSPEKDLVVR